jgi:hypothetical protein
MAKKKKENLNKAAKKRTAKEEQQESLQARIDRELAENEGIQEYLSQYSEFNRSHFLQSYSHQKYMWTKFADTFEREAENDALDYLPSAEGGLWEIQQKKLFDLQCRWRAGEMELEGVQTTQDFRHWEYDIRICPFLDPITEAEVELYVSYLNSPYACQYYWAAAYQTYYSIKDDYLNDAQGFTPLWYAYHYTFTQSSRLLQLPDLKGDAEFRYTDAVYKHSIAEQKKAGTYKEPTPIEDRPDIDAHNKEDMERFIKKFESKVDYNRYLHYMNSKDKDIFNEEVELALSILEDSTEPIPIAANSDWRKAIQEAATLYRNRKIARAIPQAYANYLFKVQTGISYESVHPREDNQWMDVYEQNILKGRKLLGEPENFEY